MKLETTTMMTRTFFLLALAASLALAKPNFSGEWHADTAKSDFGDMPAPTSLVMQIEHGDPKLAVKQSQNGGPLSEVKTDLTYTTDGSVSKNMVRGKEVDSTAKWSGDALKITTKMGWNGKEVNIAETWKLTSGGKNLEILREIRSAEGGSTMKLVFSKSDKK